MWFILSDDLVLTQEFSLKLTTAMKTTISFFHSHSQDVDLPAYLKGEFLVDANEYFKLCVIFANPGIYLSEICHAKYEIRFLIPFLCGLYREMHKDTQPMA